MHFAQNRSLKLVSLLHLPTNTAHIFCMASQILSYFCAIYRIPLRSQKTGNAPASAQRVFQFNHFFHSFIHCHPEFLHACAFFLHQLIVTAYRFIRQFCGQLIQLLLHPIQILFQAAQIRPEFCLLRTLLFRAVGWFFSLWRPRLLRFGCGSGFCCASRHAEKPP